VGLFVAIPAVAMYNIFQRRLRAILARTDALGSVLLAHLVATGAAPVSSGSARSAPAAVGSEAE
jgi:hypothetical protein